MIFRKFMALLLVCVGGSLSGQKFELISELTVGRELGNTITLSSDDGVSRRHARFFWLQGLPMVEDLGSRNGTYLNGSRLSQARPVSSGDQISIGAGIFQVQAAMDQPAATPTPPIPSGQEVSRGEGRGKGQRRSEQGSAEGSLYGQGSSSTWDPLGGCALPSIDLSGCMRYLWILLLVLLAGALLAAIVFGIGALLSAAGGMASSGVSGSPPASQAPTPDNPSKPPPPADQPPPPPPAGPSVEAVVILDVKVDFAKKGESRLLPVVLVKWINGTKTPVKRLSGTVQLFDRDGKQIVEIPREAIYAGPPLPGGETHEDTLADGGIVIRQKLAKTPATAKVKIERIE